MQAGRLDRRIQIRTRGSSQSTTTGEVTFNWVVLYTLWARRVPKGAAEKLLGNELVSEVTDTWSVRHNDDIDSTMQLRYKELNYRIVGVQPAAGRDIETLILTVKEEPERA